MCHCLTVLGQAVLFERHQNKTRHLMRLACVFACQCSCFPAMKEKPLLAAQNSQKNESFISNWSLVSSLIGEQLDLSPFLQLTRSSTSANFFSDFTAFKNLPKT